MQNLGWTWAQTVVLLAAIIALGGAVLTATVTYALNQRTARRERQARSFAEALAAIEEYAEMPYRIRRRTRSEEGRYELSEKISDVQARMAFHQAWLSIESVDLGNAYKELVAMAKKQAGGQMKEAWKEPILTRDAQMILKQAYSRDKIDDARESCVVLMRMNLGRVTRRSVRINRGGVEP
ncbi:hypothetical protein GCM10009850_079470 [Nonomuraea monospora]|uniref:Secreted protein n=2 Tax=Nonomuraea monospora TaxID=568818 RepID=A0ABN3CSQ7_9ACTN